MKLRCTPAHDFAKLFRNCCLAVRHDRQHFTLTIAANELHWNFEVQQTLQCFTWHWARKDIASHYNQIYLHSTNVLKNSLKRGQVAMDVIDSRDSHGISLSIDRRSAITLFSEADEKTI